MLNDKIKMSGELQVTLYGPDGLIKTAFLVPNLVVTVGKGVVASRLTGNSVPVMSHMAVGSSGTAPIAANTALGSELTLGRSALNVAGGVASGSEVTFTASFGAGAGTGAITEAGIFNSGTVGTMLCRSTFAAVNKDTGDTLSINWKLTVA